MSKPSLRMNKFQIRDAVRDDLNGDIEDKLKRIYKIGSKTLIERKIKLGTDGDETTVQELVWLRDIQANYSKGISRFLFGSFDDNGQPIDELSMVLIYPEQTDKQVKKWNII